MRFAAIKPIKFVIHFIFVCLLLNTITVYAEQASKLLIQFDLPAGELGDVLNLYSRQAGVTLSYEERIVQGIKVPANNGNYSAEAMLFSLLNSTNLLPVKVADNAWLIQDRGQQSITTLETIQVESRRDQVKDKAYRESASVNVLTQENIERFRGTSVGDIFQGIPGVLISENRNSGGLDVNIRGMQGQGRVPVLIDGSRQETTVYRGYSGVSSRSYIDPDLIGNLQISKGPVMTAQGTGATGGLVSVNTLSVADIVKPGEDLGFRLRASGIGNSSSAPAPGTYAGYHLPGTPLTPDQNAVRLNNQLSRVVYRSDCRFAQDCPTSYLMPERFAPEQGMDRPALFEFSDYAASFAAAKRFDWGDVVAAYAKREQGNYYAGTKGTVPVVHVNEPIKLPFYTETLVTLNGVARFRAGERVANTNFSSESLLLKSSVYLPDDQSLEFSYIRYDSDYGEMMPSQIRGFGQIRQWLNSEVLNQTYTARYRWQPVEYDWADLKINLWHTNAITDLNTPSVGSIELADNIARTDDYQRWGIDIANTMLFYPIGELKFDYGLAGQWEDMDNNTPEADSGFYAGSRRGWRREFSAFTHLSWQPWQDWTFAAGLRYTHFSAKDNNPIDDLTPEHPACQSDGNSGCLPVTYRNSQSGGAPSFTVTWEPLAGLQFYLRHAQALRMPSLFESSSGLSVSPALDITLKPEHAKNSEFGINYLASQVFNDSDKFRVKSAYFANHVDDYLTRTGLNAFETPRSSTDFFRLRNIDSLDLRGIEFDLSYDATTWLFELKGTKYSHIEVCNVASYVRYYCTDWGLNQSYFNNMIPPNWHASAHVGARLFDQILELGLRATLMGKRNRIPQYNARPGFNRPVLWENYRVFDLYANYQITPDVAVDLTIDNITDRYYLDALSLGLVPAPGRTARLSVNLQF
ncbi:TonB-dependent receptor [Endozoicomonas sp. G2_1]|uniref:TonB-dependent receptor n=1 Tax=Endozoicomonas sp. G2_1 TaxID=2821091 RepID=UPI001ADC131F|nr:TonB-dependent receptor [Endozoicomonas sp. G2_1]MBO9489681.1 TonB-dependent receptor [Endozoicomonas sp. G2_1]